MKHYLVWIIVAAAHGVAVQAQPEDTQRCNPLVDRTTPVSRFDFDQGTGTALDRQTGLLWQRCPLGYELNDGGTLDYLEDDQCESLGQSAVTSWQGALQSVETHNSDGGLAGVSDWRLPNLHELASITERQCHHPALNLLVFPVTGDFALISRFWSASANPSGGFYGPTARVWDYRYGRNYSEIIDSDYAYGESYYVRLVR